MDSLHNRSRWVSYALSMALLVIMSTSAGAQSLFGGLSGMPSFGGGLGGPWGPPSQMGDAGSCCDPYTPAPYITVYVGWQGGNKQTLSAGTDQGTSGALFRSIKFDIPNEGIWLGAGAAFDVTRKFSLGVQGWYLVPSHKSGSYIVDPGLQGLIIELPGNLDGKVDWWYVDVLGKYRYSDHWWLVLGGRFDHHNFSANDSDFGFPDPTTNPYRLDLNALTTSLLFGLEFSNPNSMTLRAVYAPVSWTSGLTRLGQSHLLIPPAGANEVSGNSTINPNYLVEIFAEYSKPVASGLKMGVFGRATWLHAAGSSSLDETVRGRSASYDFSYYCANWVIGGKAALSFDLSGRFY